MESIHCVTARGRGEWGRPVEVELATSTMTWLAQDRVRSFTASEYLLVVSDAAIGSRGFRTAAERAAFLAASFTQLELSPVEPSERRERAHALAELVGLDLVGVSFVRDYLQLEFDHKTLNLYVWPRVWRSGALLKRAGAGYTDALVSLISATIIAVDEILDLGLVLDFAAGTRLTVPLDGTEVAGLEIAEFDGRVVWTPDDRGVEWLPCL